MKLLLNASIDDLSPLTGLHRQFCKACLAAWHEMLFGKGI